MARLEVLTEIAAPPAVCFDLARDVDLHTRSLERMGEEAIGGVTTGRIGLGEEVTFRARLFGLHWTHTARVTVLEAPHHFRDEGVRGPFQTFVHDHAFEAHGKGTRMVDRIAYTLPFGWFGELVARLVVDPALARLLRLRGEAIRSEAEVRASADRRSTITG